MAWESCIVLLNSDSTGTFYTGDIVTGSVVLEFKNEQKIERIDLKVIGKSKAHWTRPMPTGPFIRIFSEKEKLIDLNIDVFRDLEGKTVKPGIQTFHFHFALPLDLPSSFKSSIAKVNYFIKIEGRASFKFKKQKIVPFIVHGNINLNNNEEYLVPSFHQCKTSFWNKNEFSIRFKTYTAFAPRQYVPFQAILINEKKVRISKIVVTLVRKVQYNVSSGYANEEKNVFKVEHSKLSNTMTETCNFGMEIPQTVPSSIHITNATVDISYIFRVEVIFTFHSTLYEDIPVTVATIPVVHNDFQLSDNSKY